MSQYQFQKIKIGTLGYAMLISKAGKIRQPVALFLEDDVMRFMEKWKKNKIIE